MFLRLVCRWFLSSLGVWVEGAWVEGCVGGSNLLFAYLKTVYICFEMYLSEIEPFDWPIYFGPFF